MKIKKIPHTRWIFYLLLKLDWRGRNYCLHSVFGSDSGSWESLELPQLEEVLVSK